MQIITDLAIHLARDNLTGLVSNLASKAIKILKKKRKEKELWEQEKDLMYLF